MTIDKIHLIFSGFNQRAVIAFIRTLIFNKQRFAIICKSEEDPILDSAYKSNVSAIRKVSKLDLQDIINSITETKNKIKAKSFIIAPSTEALNRFILNHRSQFEKLNCLSPLIDKQLYNQISDKYSFSELCIKHGIKVPIIYKSYSKAKIPFVAKPFHYFTKKGSVFSPILIMSEQDREAFIKNYVLDDFFYQQFVFGQSIYLLYYFSRDGKFYKFSQENIVQQPDGKSIIAAKSTGFHLTEESIKYEKMLTKIGFHGFIMVEVRKHRLTNYMIEANPRFWGPSQLFVDANRNFFEAYLHDIGTLSKKPIFSRSKKSFNYFWLAGLLQSYKKDKIPTFHKKSEKNLFMNLDEWTQADIYKREDTIEIFKKEIIFSGTNK